MKKNFVKVLAAVTVGSVLGTNLAYADSEPLARKSETIYVTQDSGKVKDKTVSVWINGDKNVKIKDKSDLKNIKNLETDEKIDTKDGYINWNSDDKDVYYQGSTDKQLPVDVSVKYFLDGTEAKLKDLKATSGHLKIVTEAVNNTKENAKIDGKDRKVFSPYVVLTEITFDDSQVSNIDAGDGKVVKDGKNQIVSGVLTPGLRENFDGILDNDKLDKFKDKMEVEMDVKDYEPTEIYTVITNEVFQEDNKLSSLDDLNDGVDKLTSNADKLVDASSQLKDGSQTLNQGIGKLGDGSQKLADGSAQLKSGVDKLSSAFSSLPPKINAMQSAVSQLNNGGSKLNNGLNQYTAGVSQVNSNMTKLNKGAQELQNGANELDNGIAQLSQATGTLREKTSSISPDQDMGKFKDSLGELKTGIDNFDKSITPMVSSVDELNAGLNKLQDSSAGLNQGIDKLNQVAQNTPSVESSVEDLTAKATALEGLASSIESKDSEGSYADEVYTLRQLEQGLYAQAENLKANAQATGTLAAGLGELSNGSCQLSAGIAKASQGTGELSAKLNESKGQLGKASQGLSAGIAQIDKGFSKSDIGKLQESIVMLDEATGKIKAGSSKLKAGTNQNQEGVEKLTGAMNQLDSKSAELRSGSQKLSGGLSQFEEKSKALSSLGNINETAINPLSKGAGDLNSGALELRNGVLNLKEGSDTYVSKFNEFDDGLKRYKLEGIDKLTEKTGDLTEVKDILDQMSKMAKENNSISGSTNDFETRSRIIEKIK